MYPVSRALRSYCEASTQRAHPGPNEVESVEYGAGGDCLYHSVAGVLARMVLNGGSPARHVLKTIPSTVFLQGANAVMLHLRAISAMIYLQWAPEQVLDFILSACMQQRINTHLDEWNPEALLTEYGFDSILHAESVLAVEEQGNGDALMRLAFTQAHFGAAEKRAHYESTGRRRQTGATPGRTVSHHATTRQCALG